MIANHFTVARNWPSIQKYGLVPYTLDEKFKPFFTIGVLAWPEEHNFESELGLAIYHAKTKGARHTIQVRIEYCDLDIMRPNTQPGDIVRLYHNLTDEDFLYHSHLEMFVLGHIPPDCVQLAASYDMRDL